MMLPYPFSGFRNPYRYGNHTNMPPYTTHFRNNLYQKQHLENQKKLENINTFNNSSNTQNAKKNDIPKPQADNKSNSSNQKNSNRGSNPFLNLFNFSGRENTENNEDNSFFEIFGIKLFYDDILIICMLFFLYNEGIEDQSLFFALILLLIS